MSLVLLLFVECRVYYGLRGVRWLLFVVRRVLFAVVYDCVVVVRCLLRLGVVRCFMYFVVWYVLLVIRYVLVVGCSELCVDYCLLKRVEDCCSLLCVVCCLLS